MYRWSVRGGLLNWDVDFCGGLWMRAAAVISGLTD